MLDHDPQFSLQLNFVLDELLQRLWQSFTDLTRQQHTFQEAGIVIGQPGQELVPVFCQSDHSLKQLRLPSSISTSVVFTERYQRKCLLLQCSL
jgi:hypothetical protein